MLIVKVNWKTKKIKRNKNRVCWKMRVMLGLIVVQIIDCFEGNCLLFRVWTESVWLRVMTPTSWRHDATFREVLDSTFNGVIPMTPWRHDAMTLWRDHANFWVLLLILAKKVACGAIFRFNNTEICVYTDHLSLEINACGAFLWKNSTRRKNWI